MAERVGVLGATSLVGECLLPLLCRSGYAVSAFSRNLQLPSSQGVSWHHIEDDWPSLDFCICAAPVWALPDYFDRLRTLGAKRLVVLSSTSRFTKDSSSDCAEREIARRLAAGESDLQRWAESSGIEWVIFRPTLIYGRGRDKNVAEIAGFIRRFGFFPVFGRAMGLRQPIHAEDIADACISALQSPRAANRSYDISGGETLSYREMVTRIFSALDLCPRFLKVPLPAFRVAAACLRPLRNGTPWTAAMAERMNLDLVFDHSEAARDLGFSPRRFRPRESDLQRNFSET